MLFSHSRGGEWYFKKRGSPKILAGSRNLGSVFNKSQSLVFAWFVFTFFESRNFLPKSLGLGFLTRISVSRLVSGFTIRHPSFYILHLAYTFAMLSHELVLLLMHSGSFFLFKGITSPLQVMKPHNTVLTE